MTALPEMDREARSGRPRAGGPPGAAMYWPQEWLLLVDFIDRLGRRRFGDAWSGSELRRFFGVPNERETQSRRDAVLLEARDLFASGAVATVIHEYRETGDLVEMKPAYWASNRSAEAFDQFTQDNRLEWGPVNPAPSIAYDGTHGRVLVCERDAIRMMERDEEAEPAPERDSVRSASASHEPTDKNPDRSGVRTTSHVSVEQRCVAELKALPPMPRLTKEEAFIVVSWGLDPPPSGHALERAWAQGAHPSWKRPGAPPGNRFA